jgi:hypothetical protein
LLAHARALRRRETVQNIRIETASRAWPRIRKFIATVYWSSYSVMLR